jgi:predicted lipoprotein with Yx(FWY)xxD motif
VNTVYQVFRTLALKHRQYTGTVPTHTDVATVMNRLTSAELMAGTEAPAPKARKKQKTEDEKKAHAKYMVFYRATFDSLELSCCNASCLTRA